MSEKSVKKLKFKQASELYAEALECFADFPTKNRSKVIDFVFNYVETGNKSQSAIKAGFGNMLGTEKTEKQLRDTAAAEADRYLKKAIVRKAYEALLRKHDMGNLSTRMSTKENSLSLLNQIAITKIDSAPAAAQRALDAAAKLQGHYEDAGRGGDQIINNININHPKNSTELDEEKKRLQELGFSETSAEEDAAVTKGEG